MSLKWVLIVCSGLLLTSCKDTSNTTNQVAKSSQLGDVLGSHIDSSVAPGDDFFQYTNGGWLKKNPIPNSESEWGIFNLVADENYAQLKRISEEASSSNSQSGSAAQKIGDFFYSGMDSLNIDKQGLSALQPWFDKINKLTSSKELAALLPEFHEMGVNPGFDISINQDMKNSNINRVYFSQGGLGLPDRDYYFNTDAATQNIKKEYHTHIKNMMAMVSNDTALVSQIVQLETNLAGAHKKLAELRDPYANYHVMTRKELDQKYPALQLSSALDKLKLTTDTVIVGQPEFMSKLNSLLNSTSLDVWKAYLKWHTLTSFASYLPSKFDKENFQFYGAILNGSKEQRVRWKRVLDAEEDALGDALGQLFVKEYFPEKTKKRYVALVEQIVISYREHIEKLDWMSDSTKKKAITKLNAITKKVGYPDKWKDYSSMNISRESFCKNVMAANTWSFHFQGDKLNKPVDRSEWSMTPQTYNAYYNPSNNEIVLPAAIFTAPGYKDDEIDDAVIYGYVGASTIGHELTHGFDDEGRQFDEVGNLKNWWSKDNEMKFKKKADMLVDQFNKFTVLDSLHPNGRATLGENIADLGGIVIALDAFKKTTQFKEGKTIAGLTPLQRYFMGYAFGWMQTRTPEKLASQLLTDVHAPIFLRVNGPMTNCDEWYSAFDVTPTHKLYRDSTQRVRIW